MKISTTVRVCNSILGPTSESTPESRMLISMTFRGLCRKMCKGQVLQPLKSSYESFSNSQVAFEEPPVFSSDMGMVHRSLTQNSVKQWGFAMIGPSESYFNIES